MYRDAAAKGGAASCQGWVQNVIARHMDVKPNTPVKEIRSMLRVQFSENVPYKVCQLARLGLQGGDLATPGQNLTPYMPESLSISTWKRLTLRTFLLSISLICSSSLSLSATHFSHKFHAAGRRKRDSGRTRYGGLGERQRQR
jgi:hypothetical protein